MTAAFFIHFIHSIDFCHQPNRNQVFSILEHVLSQFSKVINMNFAFGELHLLATVAAAWDHTFYTRRHYMKINSVYCFNLYIYIYIYIYTYIYIYIYIYILFFTY